MKLEKLSIDGKKDSIEVLDKIFSAKVNSKLVSSVLYKTNANYKGRHAKTKQQNEVRGPTSKIYAQKGTGGARHASRKAPIFVGGGIAHGPKGELSYKKRKLNKNEKKLSVASLITEKTINKNLLILNDFSSEIKKTKEMNAIIQKLEITHSLIILDKNSKEKIEKSARNIPNVKITDVNHFSSTLKWLASEEWDFVMAIGDDHTDEDTFQALPEEAITIKVGLDLSNARYNLLNVEEVRGFLKKLLG